MSSISRLRRVLFLGYDVFFSATRQSGALTLTMVNSGYLPFIEARMHLSVHWMEPTRMHTWTHALTHGCTMSYGTLMQGKPVRDQWPSDQGQSRTHTRMHACTHARTHACTHARTHACTNARVHSKGHVPTYARAHARLHRCMQSTCTCTHTGLEWILAAAP